MYNSDITLKDWTFKVVCKAYLYHQVMSYDHVIAYAQISFFVIDTESMINDISARKTRHAKRHSGVVHRAVHASGCTIFYCIRTNIALTMFSMFSLYHDVGSSTITQECYTRNIC